MNNQSGLASRTLIVIAFVVLLAIILVYVALRFANAPRNQTAQPTEQTNTEPPKPVYTATLADIQLSVQSVRELGSVLKAKTTYMKDLTTTERFIQVTIGAQNKGKVDTTQYAWDIGNIVDSEGRNFIPITNQAYDWLPRPDLCGAILKPDFDPVPCVRIFEVAKVSTGLKVQVMAAPAGSSKKESALLDLAITQ